jgi:hypothetical protein
MVMRGSTGTGAVSGTVIHGPVEGATCGRGAVAGCWAARPDQSPTATNERMSANCVTTRPAEAGRHGRAT